MPWIKCFTFVFLLFFHQKITKVVRLENLMSTTEFILLNRNDTWAPICINGIHFEEKFPFWNQYVGRTNHFWLEWIVHLSLSNVLKTKDMNGQFIEIQFDEFSYGQSDGVDLFPIVYVTDQFILERAEKEQKFIAAVKIIRQPKCWHVKTQSKVKSSKEKK